MNPASLALRNTCSASLFHSNPKTTPADSRIGSAPCREALSRLSEELSDSPHLLIGLGITLENNAENDTSSPKEEAGKRKVFNIEKVRFTTLKTMESIVENNKNAMMNCIQSLKNFETENTKLDAYAHALAKYIQIKYDNFEKISPINVENCSEEYAYKAKKSEIKKSIDEFNVFIKNLNEKIEKDATPIRPVAGSYTYILEALLGFTFAIGNMIPKLDPTIFLAYTIISVIIGIFLFIARMHLSIKVFIFEKREGATPLPSIGVKKIKRCIPNAKNYNNLTEEELLDQYYKIQEENLNLLTLMHKKNMDMEEETKKLKLKLGSVHDTQNKLLEMFDRFTKDMSNYIELTSGDNVISSSSSPMSSRASTPLPGPIHRRTRNPSIDSGFFSSALPSPAMEANKNFLGPAYPNNIMPLPEKKQSLRVPSSGIAPAQIGGSL